MNEDDLLMPRNNPYSMNGRKTPKLPMREMLLNVLESGEYQNMKYGGMRLNDNRT
jgi:hypothetical protein